MTRDAHPGARTPGRARCADATAAEELACTSSPGTEPASGGLRAERSVDLLYELNLAVPSSRTGRSG